MAVAQSNIEGEMLYIDVRLSSTASLSGNKHWLLVIDDNTKHAWIFFKGKV